MSRIKSFLFGLMAICLSTLSFGQQDAEPALCKDPSIFGFVKDSKFTISPDYGCLDYTRTSARIEVSNSASPTGGALSQLGYIFDFKDVTPLALPVFPTVLQTSTVVTTPGKYWVMQGGNVGGTAYITCRVSEILQTEQPDFDITSCGDKSVTVTFRDTPKNRKHGKYRIVWGDGNQDFSAQITVWPHQMQHTYINTPTGMPQIVAAYTRGASNFTVCTSQPISFPVGSNGKPRISELEGLNGGASNKITLSDGSDGTAYTIQQKPKGGNWVDTGKKITRNSGTTTANQTIDGLDGKQEYCFRLQTKDGCNNDIFSNEACTIIPKATVSSPTEAKIEWNNPDADLTATPNVTRYSVGYSESPSGANPNTGAPSPITGTSYVFDLLDCSKKYNFNITAFLGTTAADKVVIKSPNILVDPSVSFKLPAISIGTVSTISKDIIQVNTFEPSGYTAPKYIFYRAEGGSSTYTQVKETPDNRYDDKNVEPDKQQYCYKVEYQDRCGNTSVLSPAFCSVFLTSAQANTLNWTQFIIPDPNNALQNAQPVEYYVELLDANGSVVKPVDTTPDTKSNVKDVIDQILSDPAARGQVTFRILARQKVTLIIGGVATPFPFSSYSNTYTFITPAQIYVPTAFSPNDDSNNDTFVAKGRFIVEYNLVIYDRWGNTIFESKDLETGWNGTTSDGVTPAPPGNYGYKIYGLDPAGQKFEKVGSITLIR
ncbi:gliding motility-associated C-terminal domain-containing protein [Emticicia sp. SJ17W-69]|uniref:T9SS type B sorting domain-containing protein n=1 Tax=Emticicia sp. SJ17W-69 TaxID=3421657 RepID=UPI003EC0ACF4